MEKCKRCGQEMSDEILAKIAVDDAECEKKSALYAEAVEKWNDLYRPDTILYIFSATLIYLITLILAWLGLVESPSILYGSMTTISVFSLLGSPFIGILHDRKKRIRMKKKMEVEYPKLFSILESRRFSFGETMVEGMIFS